MKQDLEITAYLERDIRPLLIHHNLLSFRAHISFPAYKRTLYGHEHRCTYNQCLAGDIPHILLKKQWGYQALIDLIERKYKGQFSYATIYMRSEEVKNDFPYICRQYTSKGEDLEKRQDPVLSEDEISIVYFKVNALTGRLYFLDQQPFEIDFKKEVDERLSNQIPVNN
jgi:hypothetical protein